VGKDESVGQKQRKFAQAAIKVDQQACRIIEKKP
jgi:hypothetical protein